MHTATGRSLEGEESDDQRLLSFASALDRLRSEVEAELGATDTRHIERVCAWSTRFEIWGRGLIHFSVEPVSFVSGVALLWLHKSLELMAIGHTALHGAYDGMRGVESLHARRFRWKAPIRGAPLTLADRDRATVRAAKRAFWSKTLHYYGREYLFFPLLAGPFFWKTLLGNVLSEIGRDVYAAAIIYCGHVGTADYPRDMRAPGRAEWYVMQVESSRDVDLPGWLSILCGGLDKQIEHHLFPRLPPNRLREVAPRVKKICEEHGVRYLSGSWPSSLRQVLRVLSRLSLPDATPLAAV